MKHFFLLGFFFLLVRSALAQDVPARFRLKGRVIDTAAAALNGATVMLLSPRDSTLLSFTRTAENGSFSFKDLKRIGYLLKVSYVGSIPHNRLITPPATEEADLGSVTLKPINRELMEVVVRTARAPLTIKGDTIEYNAASFKVPPGATVEELLRRLPGMQIDQEGTIRAQGQEVKRVTVDGKSFFGNDPKMATKNLPADAIARVQVFTDKSEQAKITGVDDGKKEKTVNLELKEEARKGGFGKVTTGAGSDLVSDRIKRARGELKGNYNKFNAKRQFSGIGLLNNTNQTGLSWNDYQDFRGSNTFNGNDEADFGFTTGVRFLFGSEEEESLTIPVNGSRGRGFSDNQAAGVNYNFDTPKTKFSSNYYYSRTGLKLDALRNRENFLGNSQYLLSTENSDQVNSNLNHRGSLRFEQAIDSLTTLIFINNTRHGSYRSRLQADQQLFRNGETLATRNRRDNYSSGQSLSTASTLLFRRKFIKKGRHLAASATLLLNNSTSGLDLNTTTDFYGLPTQGSQTVAVRQNQQTSAIRNEYKFNLLYTEPFRQRFFWENFYNLSLRYDEVDRDVTDRRRESVAGRYPRLDSLSRFYENNYLYNRLGSGIRYNHKGVSLLVGAAAQRFDLRGYFAPDQLSATRQPVSRSFMNVVPAVSLSYDLRNNRYLTFNYGVYTRMPSSRDLQPIVDNTNPLFIAEGNPNLLPMLSHNLYGGYSYFNSASFTNFWGNLSYNYNVNQIVYNQTVDPETLVTRTRPQNISGGFNVASYVNFSFPLRKTKSSLSLGSSTNYSESLIFINTRLNTSMGQNYSLRTRLDLTPVNWFTLYANADWGMQTVRYSVDTRQNQRIYTHTYGSEMNLQLPGNFYLNSSLNYRIFVNSRFAFNQHVPILNLSAYKILGKEQRWEVRATLYDALNRNLGVSQTATQNYVSQERVQTISRYAMLSLSYNMRGLKPQLKREGP